jgi:hypothetical protein
LTKLSQIFHRDKRDSSEDKFYIARDPETGRVFILHKWREKRGEEVCERSTELDVLDFLRSKGRARDAFLSFIGRLAMDHDRPLTGR